MNLRANFLVKFFQRLGVRSTFGQTFLGLDLGSVQILSVLYDHFHICRNLCRNCIWCWNQGVAEYENRSNEHADSDLMCLIEVPTGMTNLLKTFKKFFTNYEIFKNYKRKRINCRFFVQYWRRYIRRFVYQLFKMPEKIHLIPKKKM